MFCQSSLSNSTAWVYSQKSKVVFQFPRNDQMVRNGLEKMLKEVQIVILQGVGKNLNELQIEFIGFQIYNQQKMEEDDEFGSWMFYLWGPVMNIAIILAIYSYRKYAVISHAVISSFVGIFSLAVSLHILVTTGFPDGTDHLSTHYYIGFIAMLTIMIQLLLGLATKLLNIFDFGSSLIQKIRMTHKIFGYLMTILSKSNYYVILYPEEDEIGAFYGLLAMDIVVVILIVLRKVTFPKLEKYPASELTQEKCSSIQSLKQLQPSKQYVIFANHVYDIEPLKGTHPIGVDVIQSVANRDIDRYLYGMYSSEKHPEISPHSHSFRSLKLLDEPVAKIDIPQTCSDLKPQFQVAISSFACVSHSGGLYQLKLKCLEGVAIFQGYKQYSQLGRFRSLILDNSVTRLYTNVYFVLPSNIKLMEQIFPGELTYQQDHLKNKTNSNEFTEVSMEDISENPSARSENVIPMVFKRYQTGKLTNQLVLKMLAKEKISLCLSCEKGLGLQLKELGPGKVIIIAGGTGLLPFSDLIDLLFKDEYSKANPAFRKRFCELSPILSKPFLQNSTFQLIASFKSLEDIHKVTLLQLMYLNSKSAKLKVTLRVNNSIPEENKAKLGFPFVNERFDLLLDSRLRSEVLLAKVWVCGPPSMNQGMTQYLSSRLQSSKYLIL